MKSHIFNDNLYEQLSGDAQPPTFGGHLERPWARGPLFKNNGYVFPNKNGTGPMVDPRKTLKKITDHAHIEPIRPHDLRHTFSHIAKYEANMSEGEVGKFLNHKESITDSYIGHHHAKQKKQLSTIENYLSQLIIIDEKKPKERFQGLFLHFFYDNDDDYMPAANLKEDRPFEDYLV